LHHVGIILFLWLGSRSHALVHLALRLDESLLSTFLFRGLSLPHDSRQTRMSYTKLESSLDRIDRQVLKYYNNGDDQSVIDLAWKMGYDGDEFFSRYAQRIISDMFPGLLDMARATYQDGLVDRI
jgi:hypothetical protein